LRDGKRAVKGNLAMEQEAPQPHCEDAFVDAGGARVHYLHAGTGKPVVLIHGLVGCSENWRKNISALAANASVYAIDLVNIGKSPRAGEPDARLSTTANRIVAVMNALNLAEADVIAHSHGGAVALMLAAMHPKRVRRLILFAPANPFSRSSDVMVRIYSTRWGRALAWMLPYLPAPIQRIALGPMYGGADRVDDRCLREIVAGLRNPAVLRHVLCVIHSWYNEMIKLKVAIRRAKRTPILLVWGARDCTVSLGSGIKLNRKLRASQLIVIPGCGHAVFEEKPEESNGLMLEWLGRDWLPAPRHKKLRPSSSATTLTSRTTPRTAPVQRLSRETLS